MAALGQTQIGEQPLEDGAHRRCIVSGSSFPKDQLLRFVAGPDGDVVPDFAGELPGRGLWITPRRDALQRACAKNLFSRAARMSLRIPDDLIERVEGLAKKRGLSDLSLARRAGQLVAGFEKVKGRLAAGQVAVLCQAIDGAVESREKLWRLAKTKSADCHLVEVFTAEEMGKALGCEPRVHVAIDPGPLANRFVLDSLRLRSLRGSHYEDLSDGMDLQVLSSGAS
ncbi:MAG: RNA-binding protein [Pseudomonadota bacterium]